MNGQSNAHSHGSRGGLEKLEKRKKSLTTSGDQSTIIHSSRMQHSHTLVKTSCCALKRFMMTIKQYVGMGTALVGLAAFMHRYHVNFWQHNGHPKQGQYHLSATHILRLCSVFNVQ